MLQDSVHTQTQFRELPIIDNMVIDEGQPTHSRPMTPYQVLRMLPRDATPAQQDSAIQAWFQPGEIHYSDRPDTLHLPGHEPGHSSKDVSLPQYYREGFFSKDTLLHPEMSGGRYGVAGDPIPYTVRSDNMFTSLLLFCLVIFIISMSRADRFIGRQLKDFFYFNHKEENITETSGELRFQLFLIVLGCILGSVTAYLYITEYVADVFVLSNDFQLIAIFFGCFVGYFIVKGLLYSLVNTVFFGGNKNLQWIKADLFLTATESVLVFPAVMLQVYFDLSIQNVTYYYVFVVIFIKLLTFYKSLLIFFSKNSFFLQNFLYFCTLEITPMLGFTGALLLIVDLLKVNF